MDLNTQIFYFINNDLANPAFNAVLPNFTHLGGFTFMGIFIAALLILTRFDIFSSKRYYSLVKTIAGALILMVMIVSCLKLAFHAPRPFMILDHVNLPAPFGGMSIEDPNSFPSGHSATSAAVVSVIILRSKEYFKKYNLVNVIAVLFFVVIAFSRIYIGMHFPLDVLTGSVIGMVCGVLAWKFLKV